MARIRQDDRSAFGTLLERYWSALVIYAGEFVGGDDPAQDVVQETFIRVWRRRREWTAGGSVAAFLYRITRNLALNARRDHAAELARRERRERELIPSRFVADPQQLLEARSLRDEVEAAINGLPARRRQVFVLARYHQLTYREIAEVMGIAQQTVANQMMAALSELRIALGHHMSGDG